jgi:hypothetical protein
MDPLPYLFCNSIAECTFVFETVPKSWGSSDREIAETVLIPGWSYAHIICRDLLNLMFTRTVRLAWEVKM